MSEKIIVHGNELYHFGIKGQKWGERRYQNEDGSLTPEGRERYGSNVKRMGAKKLKKQYYNWQNNLSKKTGSHDKIMKKISGKLETTDAYKEKVKVQEELNDIARLNSMGIMVKSNGLSKRVYDTNRKYMDEIRKITNEYGDTLAENFLKDAGYEVTDKGKKYVQKIMKDNW